MGDFDDLLTQQEAKQKASTQPVGDFDDLLDKQAQSAPATPAQLAQNNLKFDSLVNKGLKVGYSALAPEEKAQIDSAYGASGANKSGMSLDQVHAEMDQNAEVLKYGDRYSGLKGLFNLAVDGVGDYFGELGDRASNIIKDPTKLSSYMSPEAKENVPKVAEYVKNNPAKTATLIATPFIPEIGIPTAMALSGATEGVDKVAQYYTGENKDNLKDNLIDVGGAAVTGGITNSLSSLVGKGLGKVASKIASNDAKYADELSAFDDNVHNYKNNVEFNKDIPMYKEYFSKNNYRRAKEYMAKELRDQGIVPDQISDYDAAKWIKEEFSPREYVQGSLKPPTKENVVGASDLLKIGAGGFLGHALGGIPGAVAGATLAKPVIDRVAVPLANKTLRLTVPTLAKGAEATSPFIRGVSANGALIYEEGPKSISHYLQQDNTSNK